MHLFDFMEVHLVSFQIWEVMLFSTFESTTGAACSEAAKSYKIKFPTRDLSLQRKVIIL